MAKNIVIPSATSDLKAINDAIKEINDSMTRMASEKELIKDIIADISEKYELPKRFVSKMAKTYYKQSFDKETADQDDFSDLYVAVTEVK
jgi:archaellum component FlaC